MVLQGVFQWWSQAATHLPLIAQEDSLVGDHIDELLDPLESTPKTVICDFGRLGIRPQIGRKYSSLLTKAINTRNADNDAKNSSAPVVLASNLTRLRPIIRTNSPELTKHGNSTNPSYSETLSPCVNKQGKMRDYFNKIETANDVSIQVFPECCDNEAETKTLDHHELSVIQNPSKTLDPSSNAQHNQLPKSVSPHKRSITFVCNEVSSSALRARAKSDSQPRLQTTTSSSKLPETGIDSHIENSLRTRKPTIKFACSEPHPVQAPGHSEIISAPQSSSGFSSARSSIGLTSILTSKVTEPITALTLTPTVPHSPSQNSNSCNSHPGSSQATRFHEFASDEVELDDWLCQDVGLLTSRLTINDMLKKENEIRRLASEVEDEEEEDDEEEDEDDDADISRRDLQTEFCDDEDFDFELDSLDGGNESDNEAGFADSDESATDDEFSCWIPGRASSNRLRGIENLDCASRHQYSTTNSSIESLQNLSSIIKNQRHQRLSKRIRPATPDLPDSTDFVCGTLDEDRPLEEAYLSCLEARKQARRKLTPQDIDPSFPTSDTDDEKHDGYVIAKSKERQKRSHLRKSEEIKDERLGRIHSQKRTSTSYHSPKKLHSPPPPKNRHRSPPPQKFADYSLDPVHRKFRTVSMSSASRAINFTTYRTRIDLTHTKSLPRTPNNFYYQYSKLKSETFYENDMKVFVHSNSHVRGAIDIVKGLEQKRQRRKEKLYMKQNNRKTKGHTTRRPQPGIGAERMREVGLIMAGKVNTYNTYILSA